MILNIYFHGPVGYSHGTLWEANSKTAPTTFAPGVNPMITLNYLAKKDFADGIKIINQLTLK